MENENINPDEVVQEEETTQQPIQEEIPQEETVVLSKAEYNKLNRKAIAYEVVKKNPPIIKQEESINTIDQIKLGKKLVDYSDEELDFVVEHAKSKKPEDVLKALENPFIQAGIQAQREKSEKEKLTLKPNGTQPDFERPMSLEERLENARTDKEKQEILEEFGLYQEPKRRPDAFNIKL